MVDKIKDDKEASREYIKQRERENSILLDGIQQGIQKGRIQQIVEDGIEDGKSRKVILEKLTQKFSISEDEAIDYYKEYSK